MISIFVRFTVITILSAIIAACGYHFTNTGQHALGQGKTIWIPFFNNESVSPIAQTVLRRAFYDEFHAYRGMAPSNNQADADYYMKANLIGYSSSALAYNALDQVKEYNLSLEVELELFRKNAQTPLWKGRLQTSTRYPVNTDLAMQRNAEEYAMSAAAKVLADRFITNVEESILK